MNQHDIGSNLGQLTLPLFTREIKSYGLRAVINLRAQADVNTQLVLY